MNHPQALKYDTNIHNSVINDLEVEHAENLVLNAEQADISSSLAFVDGQTASISAVEAQIAAATANVTTNFLQQDIQQDTTIKNSFIEELQIQHAENVVATADQAEINSTQTTAVVEGQSFISTTEAQISANEASVSANVLHQNITNDNTITNSCVERIDIEHSNKTALSSEEAYVTSGTALVSAEQAFVSAPVTNITTESFIQNPSIQHLVAENVVVNISKGDTGQELQENSAVVQPQAINVRSKPPKVFPITKGRYETKFKRLVNQRTAQCIEGGIVDGYIEQNLVEPSFEVYPILKEIKSFYSGSMARGRDDCKTLHLPSHGEGSIGCDGLIRILQEGSRLIALVGQAGSGKTTLLKRIARELLKTNNLYHTTNSGIFSGIYTKKSQPSGSFEVIYFINIRDIPVSHDITVPDMLFDKVIPNMDRKTSHCGYKWLVKNQSKVLMMFDGLDQATWSVGENPNPINYDDSASTSTVMHNILVGNLFPRVHILLSSREHIISSLPKELRPGSIFSLAGLTLDARKKVFDALLGSKQESLWDLMCSRSPGLVPLSSIPIFLVFNAVVYKAYPNNPPDTIPGVMVKVLQILMRSEHAREGDIRAAFQRLKGMAFKGMAEKRVLFTMEDLSNFGLDANQVQDLVIKIPSYSESRILSQKLLQGDFSLYFCHQSIQEMLAGLHIAEMDLESFNNFVENTIHLPHWSIVRRFVCGVLLNEESYKDACKGLMTVPDVFEKQTILKRSLSSRMNLVLEPIDILELFASLYESNDGDFIQSLISEIILEEKELNSSEMHTIASVMRSCKHLDQFRIHDCRSNAELLRILSSSLKNTDLLIDELRIDAYRKEDLDLFLAVADIVTQCQVKKLTMEPFPCCTYALQDMALLDEKVANGQMEIKRLEIRGDDKVYEDEFALAASVVQHCKVDTVVFMKPEITAKEIKIFSEKIKTAEIRELAFDVLFSGSAADADCFIAVAELVTRCKAEKLSMDPLPFIHLQQTDADEIIAFHQIVGNGMMRITELDVSGNVGMSEDVMGLIGCIARLCQVDQVTMRDCQLEAMQMKSFQASLQGAKIKKLDIQSTIKMEPACFKAIGDVIQENCVEELSMEALHFCKLRRKEIQPFCQSVCSGKMLISTLSVNRNMNMDGDDFAAIGSIVYNCQVKTLKMEDCDLNMNRLERILEEVKGATIQKLNVMFNKGMGVGGLSIIGSIVRECKVRDVLLGICKLNLEELQSFKDSVGNSKIEKLKMGLADFGLDGFPLAGSIARQCSVEKLVLSWCDMDATGLHRLDDALGDLKMRVLKLNGNNQLGMESADENIATIINIAKRCQLQKLSVVRCDFSDQQLRNLQKALRNTVIKTTPNA